VSATAASHRRSQGGGEASGLLVPVLIGVTMVTGIISSLGAPLIPSVARSLHISLDSAQWSLTVALLSGAIAAPVLGRLGDGLHRRPTILGGLAVVFAGSIIAGLAHSLPVLVVGRTMQGVGLGIAPATMAAARDHLPPERSTAVIGLLSVAGAAAVGAGYPISGLIASDVGALMSGIALVAAYAVIPASVTSAGASLDVRGTLVVAVGLAALLLAIGQGQQWGWDSATIIGLFVAAAMTSDPHTSTKLADMRLVSAGAVRLASRLIAEKGTRQNPATSVDAPRP
jgi:MFS family permease